MVPETCNITLNSRSQESHCDLTEKWFRTKYCVEGKEREGEGKEEAEGARGKGDERDGRAREKCTAR